MCFPDLLFVSGWSAEGGGGGGGAGREAVEEMPSEAWETLERTHHPPNHRGVGESSATTERETQKPEWPGVGCVPTPPVSTTSFCQGRGGWWWWWWHDVSGKRDSIGGIGFRDFLGKE